MKCREALKLLYDYLDKQLDEKTVNDVQEHLAECKHCFETYQFEEHLNNFVKQKGVDDYSSAVDSLKIKVMHRIEELGGPDELEESPPRFFFFKPAFAAGFLAIVAIIALIFYFSHINHDLQAKTFEPFLLNHEKALDDSIEMGFVAADLAVFDTCLSKKMPLPQILLLPNNGCNLVKCKISKCPNAHDKCTAHLVYEVHGHDVSIFVLPIDSYDPPDKLDHLQNHADIYFCRHADHSFVLWSCKKYWYVAVGDVENDEFEDFVSLFK
ncbi:zf-HC2 domain-containing protein [candidate division KSB1 bacterium]|nr:zf-HC2 domain-containing protein [candidate division KSB1 bacterium]